MSLFSRGQPAFNRNSLFRITEVGKAKVQENFTSGDPRIRVLMAMESIGSSADLDELSQNTRMTRGQLERILGSMVRQGLITTNADLMGGY